MMTKEMLRPWNPWRDVVEDGASLFLFGFEYTVSTEVFYQEEQGLNVNSALIFRKAVQSLNDALNAPVLVTKEVMEAMEKAGGAYSAKSILVDAPDYSYNLHFDEQKKSFTFRGGMTFEINEQDVPIYTVQADCPLALQVLLGFTTEGVPVND
jgi:hypothetical protein